MNAKQLSHEQETILKLVELKYSLFLTGQGGSGKSYLIKKIVEKESAHGGCFVTASTGIAAVNISGTTIHTFAGINTGTKSAHELLGTVMSNEEAVKRWNECRVLVIDEISMIGAALFEKLDYVARGIRGNSQPFGGIQLLLSGDFVQLKPVSTEGCEKQDYCFKSTLWNKCVDFSLELTKVFRQNEQELRHLLQDVRNGCISAMSRSLIHYLSRDLKCDPLDKVRLFPLREDAKIANDECIDLIPGEKFVYRSHDDGKVSVFERRCSAPSVLVLKVRARVVLLKNLDKSLVNGLRGTVIGISDGYPRVRFDNNRVHVVQMTSFLVQEGNVVVGTRKQLPLDLCYGRTIHKSQSMSFPYVEVDLGKVFEDGQAYVALSRSETLSGLRILNFRERAIIPNKDVQKFYKTLNSFEDVESCMSDVNVLPPKRREITDMGEVGLATKITVESPASKPNIPPLQEEFSNLQPLDIGYLLPAIKWIKLHVVSEEMNLFFNSLGLQTVKNMEQLNNHLINFMMWIIGYFTQQAASKQKTNTSGTVIIDRKNWAGIISQLHSFLCSNELLRKWEKCLEDMGIVDIDTGVGGLHRKACLAFTRAMYEAYLEMSAKQTKEKYMENKSNFKQGPIQFSSPESMGKIRDLSGWVIVKESQASLFYIRRHKGSKCEKVQKRVKREREIKAIFDNMKENKEVLLETTKYPQSMEHIERYDKGSKSYVKDGFFEFMLAAGSLASSLFSDETFHKFKHNSIKEAWKLLISDKELKKKFEIMFNGCNLNVSTTCTPDTPSNCTVDENDNTNIMDNITGCEYTEEEKSTYSTDAVTDVPYLESFDSDVAGAETEFTDTPSNCTVDETDNANIMDNITGCEYTEEEKSTYSTDAVADVPYLESFDSDVAGAETEFIGDMDNLIDDNIMGLNGDTEWNEAMEDCSQDLQFWDGIGKVIHYRILHRFTNMYSAEFIRKVKREEKLKKSVALRPSVAGACSSKVKSKPPIPKGMPTVSEIINDPLPKDFTHFCLKAQALKGPNVFYHFSHAHLRFILQGYALPYSKDRKEHHCAAFTQVLKTSGNAMPCPEKLTQESFDSLKRKRPRATQQITVDETASITNTEHQELTPDMELIGRPCPLQEVTNVSQPKRRNCGYCGQPGHRKKYKDKLICPKYIADIQTQ